MPRLLGEMDHDECAPWCDHDPAHHAEDCSDSFCDGYKCWKNVVDIRNEPCLNVVDTYTKSGQHLGSIATTEDGRVVWEEGRIPSRDVCFLPHIDWPWKEETDAQEFA